ncbi:MAG: OsmC family peroxiredoxin [Bacteroidetes bacterium]|jgi:organic hydroperoxide reductase OsmC/OhrA|nr:OsmC family peroxiredoxin [Bacteroidota bacterium]
MKLPESHSYDVKLSFREGRIGELSAAGISETIKVATPPQFPGGVDGVWSPEHLYTASVVSCFFTSFAAIADYSKLDFVDLEVESSGEMNRNEDGKYVMDKVILKPVLTINDESKEKKAYRIMEKAEEICLVTRSIHSKIIFDPSVYIAQKVE